MDRESLISDESFYQAIFSQPLVHWRTRGQGSPNQGAAFAIIPDFFSHTTSQAVIEETLRKLPRKKVDNKTPGVGDMTECSICIENIQEGQTMITLPCQHQFHEICGVTWLKQPNSCPICRKSIDGS
ncbi:hypothetical protein B0T10DRAFT_412714 [Thelonectria olida]|uniref:RING-type domain-containing protein n=1 Tax=Thelonectria olida TaxID=1576542 RepID=A0A9P8VW07_9HYPO|nr:hypothetical protein B0T10DRAFT_412714 [Thelonectria olida]